MDQLLKELLTLAQKAADSVLKEAILDDVRMGKEGIVRKDHPAIGETYVAVLRGASRHYVEAEVKTGANAIYHATGTRVQGLPITLDKLL